MKKGKPNCQTKCVWLFFQCDKIVQSYLSVRFQRVKMKNNFNGWCKIFLGVPQGSIRCPLLFNIFLNDIFYFIQEAYIYNFAGDNSLYSIEDNYKEVETILKKNFELLQVWFELDDPKSSKMPLLNNKERYHQ